MKKPIVKRMAAGYIGRAAIKRRLAQEVKDRAAEKAARSAATKAANKKKAALAKRRDAAQAKRDAAAKQAKIKKTGKIGAAVAVGAGSLYGAGKIFGESKDKKPKPVAPARPKVRDTAGTGIPTGSELRKVARKKKAAIGQKAAEKYYRGEKPIPSKKGMRGSEIKPNEPRTIAEAKKMGKSYFINKSGKKLAAVTKEDLKKSGLSLRAYLNRQSRAVKGGRGKETETPGARKVAHLKAEKAGEDKRATALAERQTRATALGGLDIEGLYKPKKQTGVARRPKGVGDAGVAQQMADINVAKAAKKAKGLEQASTLIQERDKDRKQPKKSLWDTRSYEDTLSPQELDQLERSTKKGGQIGKKKKKVGKKKQGYKARKDESIAMRVKKKRTKKQLKSSRDESYGKKGKGKINRSSGSALVASSYD